MKFEWETIHKTEANTNITLRAKVIGGWIIKNRAIVNSQVIMGMVFIADSEYKWEI